jgi:uncharacterized protein YuzE
MAKVDLKPSLQVRYDKHGDVLYLAIGKPVPATTDEDDEGLAFRYALDDGRPCGVTIIGYKSEHWNQKILALSYKISGRLNLRDDLVVSALSTVI